VQDYLTRPVGWFAPTYKLLEEAWRNIVNTYSPIITTKNASSKRIEFATGGSVDFWSLDNASTVARGRAYALVVIDEAAMAPNLEEAWQQSIRPTLTDLVGSAWFLSTPKGLNYFHELFQRGNSETNWQAWQMPTSSNPYIRRSEIEAARRELPDIIFAQEYLAQFVTLEGGRIKREWLRYGEPEPGAEKFMAVDLAISTKESADYTAAAVMSRNRDGSLYVHDVARFRGGFADVLQFVQSLASKHNPRLIGIEQVQYQAAVVEELLRRTSLPVRGITPDRDKLSRFQPLEARYQQGLVIHSRNLPREFEDELLSFPHGPHDDMVDALSYAYSLVKLPPLTTRTMRNFAEV
jgi:predicted phage terminase large subunit-like protein